MPAEVLHFNEGKSKALLDLFLEKPNLDIKGNNLIVLGIYKQLYFQMSVTVRK